MWLREPARSIKRKKRIAVEQRAPTLATTEKSFLSDTTETLRTTAEIVEQSQTVDFPLWRSPITSSRWPFATGNNTSTTRRPVTTHGVFRERTKIEGDELSTSEILVSKLLENKALFTTSEIGNYYDESN